MGNIRHTRDRQSVDEAHAVIHCVYAAMDVQQRLHPETYSLPPSRIPPLHSQLQTQTHEELRESGRKGGSAPRQPRGLAAMSPERRRELSIEGGRKGGLATAMARPAPSAMARYGFTADEFNDWGVLRASGYGADEAAEVILYERLTMKADQP